MNDLTQPEHNNWGQQKTYGPSWLSGVPLTVLQLRKTVWPPEVLSITLSAQFLTTTAGRHGCKWAWQITAGVGGSSRTWLVDARPLQQLSLPAQTVTVSLVALPLFEDVPFEDPLATMSIAAFIGLGNTSTEPSTFTQKVLALAPGATAVLPVPPGAVKFRVTGFSPALNTTSPLQAGVLVTPTFSNFPMEEYDGAELLVPVNSGDWIPLVGLCDRLTIGNATPGPHTIGFNVIWGLDL